MIWGKLSLSFLVLPSEMPRSQLDSQIWSQEMGPGIKYI